MNSTPDSRIGFRDIYRAVGESEARITTLINERFGALGKDVGDHETRIRVMEQAVMPIAVLSEARDKRIEEVATLAQGAATIAAAASGDVKSLKDTQHGVLATLSAGRQAIVLGLSVVGGVVAAVDLISRVANP